LHALYVTLEDAGVLGIVISDLAELSDQEGCLLKLVQV